MKKAVSSLTILYLLSSISPVLASGPGSTSGELLKIPVGTRAIGMGEAFTALADDSSSLYWNPAGMSLMSQKEATFMHSSLIEDVHYEHLAFIAPTDAFALGGNLSYLGYGGITGYNNSGIATGDVSAYSYTLNFGISRLLNPALSLGISGGLVHETLADDSANTLTTNIGGMYLLPGHPWNGDYRLGLAVQNLGPGLKFVSERAPLPRKIKFGAAAMGIQKLPLNLTTDITLPNDNDVYVALGSEYWFREMVALRLGYAGSKDEGRGVRVGVGVKYNGVLFDYAYAGFGDFGATNRFTLSMRFGDKIRQLNSAEHTILKEARRAEKDGAYVQAVIAYDELLDRDPSNEHILHYMIKAHARMSEETSAEVAEKSVPIPSPEDAAMAEGNPDEGSPAYAMNGLPGGALPSNTMPSAMRSQVNDPLGLENLPEAGAVGSRGASKTPSQVVIPTAEAAFADKLPDRPAEPTNSPALSPADIYGN